jgi:hypothetical protein
MPKDYLSFLRIVIARRPAARPVHAQLLAGSRDAIARSRLLLARTEPRIDISWVARHASLGEAAYGSAI